MIVLRIAASNNSRMEVEVDSVVQYLQVVTQILQEYFIRENIRKVDLERPDHEVPFRTNPPAVVETKARRAWYRGQPVDKPLIPKVFRPDTKYSERELLLEARRRAFLGI